MSDMNSHEMIPVGEQEICTVIQSIVLPIVEPLCRMLKQNTEALERISATLNLQGKQIEALEKQVRMNTPVTSVQARYLNSAVRDKAYALLDRYGSSDKKTVDILARKIRKDILVRSGIASMRELPKCEYEVAMKMIDGWNNAHVIREIVLPIIQASNE